MIADKAIDSISRWWPVVATVRECVARSRSTPSDVLSQLAESGTGSAKFTVAQNPNCPPDVLVKLIDDNSYSDIRAFTRRYRCDPSTHEEAMDSVWVSVAAAGNPGTPADCLSAKLRNTVQGLVVPSRGSRIPEVNEETLRAWQTTAALMCNPSTQTEAIAGCSTITSEVLQTVRELPSPSDGDHLIGYLLEVASSTGLPLELLEDVLTTLSTDRTRSVREAVAGNPNTPVGALTALASDKTAEVREAVAKAQRLPAEVMSALSLDDDIRVRSAVHANMTAPDGARAQAALLGVTVTGAT
ncbi:MAG: hypothetical protein F2836_03085 [Actinobacteria bacterium]|uniref:Unannotated protein n=1 Tax=freshwater metagenome TaxID=449393 RepID=A0A6J7IFC9_9ZZZZ|nr:hypothetical protein [Actinomycetota bacterium]